MSKPLFMFVDLFGQLELPLLFRERFRWPDSMEKW
jgi:hypothetical protein